MSEERGFARAELSALALRYSGEGRTRQCLMQKKWRISWAFSWRAESRRAFVEFVERPFCHRHGVEDGFAEVGAAERVEASVRGGPEDVAVPFDENVVHGAVVAAEFLQVSALRW